MLSSASTDFAKLWLDLKGWPAATELLRRHGIVPSTGWGKRAAALAMVIANGFVDWYLREDTPTARFFKDLIRDVPSELMSRFWNDPGTTASAPKGHPLTELEPDELREFLGCVRGLDHSVQLRLRNLMAHTRLAELKMLAQTNAEDLATLVDLLMPPLTPLPERPSLGDHFRSGLDGLANFFVPGISPGR
jgi:hypothetical protein